MPDYQMMTGPAFIFLEWVILILLIFAILSGAGGLWWVYRDGRRGRKDLHEKIESFVDIIRAEMKEAVKPAQDGIEAHIKECRQLRKEDEKTRRSDNRWMGGVNQALSMLTNGQWKPQGEGD